MSCNPRYDLPIEIGDGVINIDLFPARYPITGGFPYSREDIATVIGIDKNISPVSGSGPAYMYPLVTIQWPPRWGSTGTYTYNAGSLLLVSKP